MIEFYFYHYLLSEVKLLIELQKVARKISLEWLSETEDNWLWVKDVIRIEVTYEDFVFPGKGFCEDTDQYAVIKARSKELFSDMEKNKIIPLQSE